MILRPATAADAAPLAAILTQWIRDTPWMPKLHSAEGNQAFLSRVIAEGSCIVADTGTPAGFLGLKGNEIGQLYISSGARRQGIGRALIERAKALRHGLSLWCFQANLPAQGFYVAQGFAEDHRTDGAANEEKLPDIRYVWRAS